MRRIKHLYFSFIDNRNPLSHRHRFDLVMGYIDHRLPVNFMDFNELFSGMSAELGVQIGKRFVQKEEVRLLYDGSGKGDTLSLSAGKFTGQAFFKSAQIQNTHSLSHSFFYFFFIQPVHTETVGNILFYRHMGEECIILENHSYISVSRIHGISQYSVQIQFAGSNRFQSADHTENGRLPAAGRAEKNQAFSLFNR